MKNPRSERRRREKRLDTESRNRRKRGGSLKQKGGSLKQKAEAGQKMEKPKTKW